MLALGCQGSTASKTAAPTEGAAPGPPVPAASTSPDTGPEPEPEPDPDTPAAWRRQEERSPGPLTFTELHYNPGDDSALEWLELHNPLVLDLDVSGWALTDGVAFTVPAGTVVPAGGFLVVAADPAQLAATTGFTGALGPWEGQLANGGERVELRSASGRRIDSLRYSDEAPWPVHADGSGFTLTKPDLDAASDRAENWRASAQAGGTPGADNALDPLALPTVQWLVEETASWRFDAEGLPPEEGWTMPDHDDSAWPEDVAPFFAGGWEGPVSTTAWATADNYFALYAGRADGSGMRLLGADTDGSWTTVEEFSDALEADEHVYLAAWELTGDTGSPQMVIAELELALPDETVSLGTTAAGWEWVLGDPGDNPQDLPANPPPVTATLAELVSDANTMAAWSAPGVEAAPDSTFWGSYFPGEFTDAAALVWADSFANSSVTDAQDTFVLFRTVDPAVPARGSSELEAAPTVSHFRTDFAFSADPATTELWLDCDVDDGAVVFLNGTEVHRENLPSGALTPTTLALGPGGPFATAISPLLLLPGRNVLAVAVHQAARDDTELYFACSLTAETWRESLGPGVLLNETPAAGGAAPWVELINTSDHTVDLGALALSTASGDRLTLPEQDLDPDGLAVVELNLLPLASGERLFLLAEDDEGLLDAVPWSERAQAREDGGGAWRTPTGPTPGAPNDIELHEDIVINEILYHRAPLAEPDAAPVERAEEWVELFNRGTEPADLSGWQLADAVSFTFPSGTVLAPGDHLVVARDAPALRTLHPDATVLGDLEGALGNAGERLLLLDAVGNPADQLRYADGGRWPRAADGGGSSLELRDPWADNARAEAWAASDEGGRSSWTTVRIRDTVSRSAVGPDGAWDELVIGLLDEGSVLIDDLSVVLEPEGAAEELVLNGDFEGGTEDWRLRGNHRHSAVVPDPEDPSNPVLHLRATGATGHMHNLVETTLEAPVPTDGVEVEVSFRARWLSGSNQLHSRLYFNRLPTTTLLPQPLISGTPGAENSTRTDTLGPTFDGLHQDVAVPAPGEPVVVHTAVSDPDGVEGVVLWAATDGGAFAATEMVDGGDGHFAATLPGLPAGSLVQIYAEATDRLGNRATMPAAGPDSRALYTVQDGAGSTTGLPGLRILMTPEDTDWLHRDVNLMSDDLLGATVVYREEEVFYDVGVRLKSSQRGRPSDLRVGYALRFSRDQPFRGSHTSVMIDRSEGVGYGQREVLLNLAMTAAGSVSGEHNDLIQLMAPRARYTGPAELQLDRFSGLVLDAQFDNGADGTRFEYELVYYPLTTEDGAIDGDKLPQPDAVVGSPITWLGADKEHWRWIFLIKNNERLDDYAAIQELGRLFSLPTAELVEQAPEVIDVDQWLRAFAMSSLAGVTDQYGGVGSQHNAQFYVRPTDGRVLFFPHDLDFYSSATLPVIGNPDLARLLSDPQNLRTYYGHLLELLDRSYTTAWLGPWCAQLSRLLPAQDFAAHCAFMDSRADWVRSGSGESVMAQFPEVDFRVSSPATEVLSTSEPELRVEGTAWVDVRSISLEGTGRPLELEWLDTQTWQTVLPLEPGENALILIAADHTGQELGRASLTVTAL